MYPKLFNVLDSYTVMIILGIILSFIAFIFLFKYKNKNKEYLLYLILFLLISTLIGFLGAIGLQAILDLINNNLRIGSMTFYGGLIFGVTFFLLIYNFFIKKKFKVDADINFIFAIAPISITLAHSIGRIGCFLEGCCYGIETNSIFGMKFPNLPNPVYPTQLFEAIFLFILSITLFLIYLKTSGKYNLSIYLISYSIFRFLIEFIRGDNRGSFIGPLAPAQFISIFVFIFGILLFVNIFYFNKKSNQNK